MTTLDMSKSRQAKKRQAQKVRNEIIGNLHARVTALEKELKTKKTTKTTNKIKK